MAADWPPRPTGRRRNARRFAPCTARDAQSAPEQRRQAGERRRGAGRSRGGGAAPAPQSAPERAAPAPHRSATSPAPAYRPQSRSGGGGSGTPGGASRAGGGRKPARGEPTRPTRSGAGAARARRGQSPRSGATGAGRSPDRAATMQAKSATRMPGGSRAFGARFTPEGGFALPLGGHQAAGLGSRTKRIPAAHSCGGAARVQPPVSGCALKGAPGILSDLSDGMPRLSVHGGQPLYLILGHYSVSSVSLWTECL